ncbi:MAG: ATP-grasp domain-containing protein [Legionellaceae bacterium]|nr:ATP-grasp domain-containing protein [Legionellaceae bacterium]
MSQLKTFISDRFRPDIHGAMLDKHHQVRFILNNQGNQHINIHAICFGPKQDRVLVNLEHAILQRDKILIFYYEDIHKRWNYVKTDSTSYFIYQKSTSETLIIHPKCLYIRGCYIKPHTNMWKTLGYFYSFTNSWQNKILCAPQRQCSNESKPYQLHHSLKKAAQNSPSISIGKSYIIKGLKQYQKTIAQKSCIVKSLSGIRSIVVDQKQYQHWNPSNIEHLPVLFQEKINGQDLRVHVIHNHTFSKLSLSKDSIDYRYDKNFFKLKNIKTLPHALKKFACSVSKTEENLLIGIDFIKAQSHYVVLEANPSPGWSAYHECNGIQVTPFIRKLLKALK